MFVFFPPEFENKRTAGSAHYHLNKICEMSGEPKILHAFTNNNSYPLLIFTITLPYQYFVNKIN